MTEKFINSIQSLFATGPRKPEIEAKKLAEETNTEFKSLQLLIIQGEKVLSKQQKAQEDREQFLSDNVETKVDQNVNRNADIKRAYMLLTGVMLIGCCLSVKGLSFFFGEFYASLTLWIILPIALILAGVLVVGSIYLNNFSNEFKVNSPFLYWQIKFAAYAMVLFIPVMNLLEGFDSNYRPLVMTLNLFGCAIDVILHTALVSMSRIFITAENSKKAIKLLAVKDKTQTQFDEKLRSFSEVFIKGKTAFSDKVKQLLFIYNELHEMNSIAASRILFLLDNFTIWMINNKVMQHSILPYHADENGHPVVELTYFSPEQDSIRAGWDRLSRIHINNSNPRETESLNGFNQPGILTENIMNQENTILNPEQQPQSPQQEEQFLRRSRPPYQSEQQHERPYDGALAPSYDSIIDEADPNPNDKIL